MGPAGVDYPDLVDVRTDVLFPTVWNIRIRIYTEEKAKVVVADWLT